MVTDTALVPGVRALFLGKTLNSHSASLHPGVKNGTGKLCEGMTCDGLAYRPGGVEILRAASCYRNRR